jgi:putative PIN family toxin of toxin-antitoxin system
VIVAVLDTNVLASGVAGIARPESTPGELLRRWRAGAFVLVVSEPILAELIRTLTNPYFAARLVPAETEEALMRLRTEAAVQPITAGVSGSATHREDDLILATALSANARYLVTGDRELQAIGVFQDSRIVSPHEFLAILTPTGDE